MLCLSTVLLPMVVVPVWAVCIFFFFSLFLSFFFILRVQTYECSLGALICAFLLGFFVCGFFFCSSVLIQALEASVFVVSPN